MQLQPLAQHRQQEGGFGQRVGGHLGLTAGRHLTLFALEPGEQVKIHKKTTGTILHKQSLR